MHVLYLQGTKIETSENIRKLLTKLIEKYTLCIKMKILLHRRDVIEF